MRWAILLGVALAVAVTVVALAWAFQRRLIYMPMGRVPAAGTVLPRAEEVVVETADGLALGAWFVPPAGESRATALIFNGNAGNRSYRAALAAALSERDMGALLFDYRGYGGNPGSPTETGLIEDARAARAYLVSRDDVDPRRLVYFGESLGTGVAVALAAEAPPAALILRSPFTSLVDIGKVHYPFLPVSTMLVDRFDSIERMAGIDCPLLVIAGDRDRIVPARQSRELFESAPMERKRLLILEGKSHNDYDMLAGERMLAEIELFIREETP